MGTSSSGTTGAAALKGKRRRFVEEYRLDRNGARAYRAAGYTAKNAHVAAVEASKLLTKPDIAAAVAEAEAAVVAGAIATREERHKFLTSALRGEHGGELKDRLKATELLGKAHGDFVERHEHTVTVRFADLVAPDGDE